MKKFLPVIILLYAVACTNNSQQLPVSFYSPGKKIKVECSLNDSGQLHYTVQYDNKTILEPSALGIRRTDGDFTKGLSVTASSETEKITQQYRLANCKRRNNEYTANRQVLHVKNTAGNEMEIIFQVSDDGVAFRYHFPGTSSEVKKIEGEVTSFHFPATAKGWLQPMSKAKTGWNQVNPCYEEPYKKGIPVGMPAPLGAGWVFPALFQTSDTWVLITEAAVDAHYCASKLDNPSGSGEYQIAFPDPLEVFPGGPNTPESSLPWYTPWRIVTIGSLATMAESTLGTDLAPMPDNTDYSFSHPGKAAWSWGILKDDSTVYSVQKRFIDYAANMNWQYCLIDADWDTQIGYDSIQLLINYAKQKNVGIWLWYNSAGSWNTTPYHPRDKLITHDGRVREFSKLQQMGVAGVKIDFFGGDGQSMMKYYIDILKDAAAHRLMVNFHGATLPRGWHKTWPHLLSAEAVKGFEYVTFEQQNADAVPAHCTVLPFTRNAFDPMDFTPMSLYRIPRIERRTTPAFELALPVLFLSGIQHFAEIPEGMDHMPDYVKEFLRKLPASWDDVKFLDGFPGTHVVLARQSGSTWYVAGINGDSTARELTLDLSAFKKQQGMMITEGTGAEYFSRQSVALPANGKLQVTMKPRGGFVLVL